MFTSHDQLLPADGDKMPPFLSLSGQSPIRELFIRENKAQRTQFLLEDYGSSIFMETLVDKWVPHHVITVPPPREGNNYDQYYYQATLNAIEFCNNFGVKGSKGLYGWIGAAFLNDSIQVGVTGKELIPSKDYYGFPEVTNERMEFLGDAVVHCMVRWTVYIKNPGMPVGEMSQLSNRYEKNQWMIDQVDRWALRKFLVKANQPLKEKAYADMFEALVGGLSMAYNQGYITMNDSDSIISRLLYDAPGLKSKV